MLVEDYAGHVTCVKAIIYCCPSRGTSESSECPRELVVFAGMGGFIALFRGNPTKCTVKHRVFRKGLGRIHGMWCKQEKDAIQVWIWGGKSIAKVDFRQTDRGNFEVVEKWILENIFLDWILDLKPIEIASSNQEFVLIGFAQNTVGAYEIANQQISRISHWECDDRSYLYSLAFGKVPFRLHNDMGDKGILDLIEGIEVACGTVFGEILIWKLLKDGECGHLSRSKAHNGVVYNICWKNEEKLISCSDDRSVRSWRRISSLHQTELIKVFQSEGYPSRVYRCSFTTPDFGNLVVTGGENGVIKLWDSVGNLLNDCISSHSGSVWSIYIVEDPLDKEFIIISGGSDSDVRVSSSSLDSIIGTRATRPCLVNAQTSQHKSVCLSVPRFEFDTSTEDRQYVRRLFILSESEAIVIGNNGVIYSLTWLKDFEGSSWRDLFRVDGCISAAERIDYLRTAIGTVAGDVIIFNRETGIIFYLLEKRSSSVNSIFFSNGFLFIGFSNETGCLWTFKQNQDLTFDFKGKIQSPYRSRFICLSCNSKFVALADAKGFIYVFDFSTFEFLDRFAPHSGKRVTFLLFSMSGDFLWTVGRNGTVLCSKIITDELKKSISLVRMSEFISKSKSAEHLYWLPKASGFSAPIVLGFEGSTCVLRDLENSELILSFPAPGGNRPSDLYFCKESSKIMYMYSTFEKKIGSHITIQAKDVQISHQRSTLGYSIGSIYLRMHSKLISQVKFLRGASTPFHLMVTGSEDNTMKLVRINSDTTDYKGIEVLSTFEQYSRYSIRCVESVACKYESGSCIVFSGGVADQLQGFEIRCASTHVRPLFSSGGSVSSFPKKAHQNIEIERFKVLDIRILSIAAISLEIFGYSKQYCLLVGNSIGSLKVYVFDHPSQSLSIVFETLHHERPVLSIAMITIMKDPQSPRAYAITGDTAGKSIVWDIGSLLKYWKNCPDNVDHVMKPMLELPGLHQSGVNAISSIVRGRDDDDIYFFCTGGDDQSICLNALIIKDASVEFLSTYKVDLCHASAVNSVHLTLRNGSFWLFSASNDKRLSLWSFKPDAFASLNLVDSVIVDVDDVSSLDVSWEPDAETAIVVVSGHGVSIVRFQLETPFK